jgi:hypothetical protein
MRCRYCTNLTLLPDRQNCLHCWEELPQAEEAEPEESAQQTVREPRDPRVEQLLSTALATAVLSIIVVGGLVTFFRWPTRTDDAAATPESAMVQSEPPAAETSSATPGTSLCTAGDSKSDNGGRTFETWKCPTERSGPVYLDPEDQDVRTGELTSTVNWFACQRQVAGADGGTGTAWLYTQADEMYANEGWGWFPAASVSAAWQTGQVPDLPVCDFS